MLLQRNLLVPEMPLAGKHQREAVLLAVFDAVLIADGTTGLDESADTGFVAQLHAVIERKEGIAGHDGARKIEPELARFLQRMTQGIDTAGLPATLADQLLALGQRNGIRLQVLADNIGEDEVFFFALTGGTAAHLFPVFKIAPVLALLQSAVHGVLPDTVGGIRILQLQQDAVLLRLQQA